jgi:hypothetical protein
VITAAALCPSPPLLHPVLTGREAVVPELSAACTRAVSWLLGDDPGEIVVVGAAAGTGEWDAAGRLDLSVFAPGVDGTGSRPAPLSLGLGAWLLDQAGYRGRRRLLAVGQDEAAPACAGIGAGLGSGSVRTGLLVMGDGSARRTLKAPGYLDPRAAGFDAEVERAIRAGELDALLRLDQDLARDLMATGRPAWQVLAGAMRELAPVAEVLYCGDPFGVAYLVACLQPRRGPGSVVGGFQGAAEFRSAAPRLEHAALGPVLHAPGPAQHAQPAGDPHSLRFF